MWWTIAAGANGLVALAYLAIALAIWRGLRTSGQVLGNRLGLATAWIFFTCAVHHGFHTVHLLMPASSLHDHGLSPMRLAFNSPWQAAWDVFTAAVGIWYWTLRGRFPALVRGPAVFEDLRLREATERTLRASEERYRRIVETTDDGVVVAGPDGTVTFGNARLGEMVGRPVEELVGRPVVDLVPAADRAALAARLAAGGDGARQQYEVRLYRADGQERWARVSATPLHDDSGEFVGSMAMLADVTGQRRLEHQVRQAQKLDAVGQLASGVAHDFNNLLTVIDGYAGLLQARLPAGRDRLDVEQIRAAARRAEALTRQLLAFSRDQHVELRLLDLNEVIIELRGMIARLIPADITLALEPTPAPAFVLADRGRIEQVIVNLVVNARDAMPSGGRLIIGTSFVTAGAEPAIGCAAAGDLVTLTVADTGVGMAPEVKARVLEPFFTTKEQGKGTGLGLSTVYGIVQQFGGQVEIHSDLGLGTVVKALLPRVTDATPVVETAGTLPPPPPAPTAGGTETILLAEDDEAVRELATRILRDAGYTVLPARDGAEAAARLARRTDVDLLVTDVIMPGMNGPQLVERLTDLGALVPVLFTSAYTRGLITAQGLLDPAVAYLEKPFTPVSLTQKVRAVLDGHARMRRPTDTRAPA